MGILLRMTMMMLISLAGSKDKNFVDYHHSMVDGMLWRAHTKGGDSHG